MKKPLFAIMALLAIFALGGCSQKQADTGNNIADKQNFRMPDFGQPEKAADVSGIVKSVIGNEITIIKIERQKRTENQENNHEENIDNSREQAKALSMTGTTGMNGPMGSGRMPGAGRVGGGMGGREMNADEQTAMLERLKAMSSGEAVVTIPVGIKMLKPDTTSAKGMEMIEASLSDIIKDKMINIWLDESSADKKIASFVLITR